MVVAREYGHQPVKYDLWSLNLKRGCALFSQPEAEEPSNLDKQIDERLAKQVLGRTEGFKAQKEVVQETAKQMVGQKRPKR